MVLFLIAQVSGQLNTTFPRNFRQATTFTPFYALILHHFMRLHYRPFKVWDKFFPIVYLNLIYKLLNPIFLKKLVNLRRDIWLEASFYNLDEINPYKKFSTWDFGLGRGPLAIYESVSELSVIIIITCTYSKPG